MLAELGQERSQRGWSRPAGRGRRRAPIPPGKTLSPRMTVGRTASFHEAVPASTSARPAADCTPRRAAIRRAKVAVDGQDPPGRAGANAAASRATAAVFPSSSPALVNSNTAASGGDNCAKNVCQRHRDRPSVLSPLHRRRRVESSDGR